MANFSDCPADFILKSGDREIRSKNWSLPDYLGELTALPASPFTFFFFLIMHLPYMYNALSTLI